MKLSLIIPCYNEEGNIIPLYNKVKETFEGQISDYEFVYINDGSYDRTGEILKELSKTADIPMKAVSFSRNFGKESAIYAGLTEASGDYISIIDGDLQQNPSIVLEMVNYLEEHSDYDCVTAFQETRNESPALIFFKDSFYKIINKISDTNFVNGASDFRTFRKSMADAVLSMTEYYRFSKGLFSWVGFKTYYMPYVAEERLSGQTKWSFVKLLKYAFEGILAFTTAPLRISLYTGALLTAGSLLYGTAVSLKARAKHEDADISKKLAALISFIGGLQLTSTGIASEYLARTYTEVKKRPIYIVKDIYTNKK